MFDSNLCNRIIDIGLPAKDGKTVAACYVSVNSNWVHPPGQPPGISSKNLPGDRDLTFESCPGAGNSRRTGILWKIRVKLQKRSVDHIFTGENTKTS